MTSTDSDQKRTKFDPWVGHSEEFKKAKAPPLGTAFGAWGQEGINTILLPGGSILTMDLSKLTLADYRQMRWHPQVNISLSVLNFMLHQLEWQIVPTDRSDKKGQTIATNMEENLRRIWSQMVGAVNQAFWAGFAPTVIEWDNNPRTGRIDITRFKDLVPETSMVHWKTVEGWAPPGHAKPKFKEYDGITQLGGHGWPIPPDNTLWYPLLMENGDYYGRKLLKPAFTPWYFSTLVHLFANRYFERFGEPTPVGRAPYDAEVDIPGGETITGRDAMIQIMSNLRNRGVVTLPSDRDPVSNSYDYTLEYLESEMRGMDFERYLSRLDEEISLGMFTPMLLFRSGDVGSNSLGVQHAQTFLWLLNGVYSDLKFYIDQYVLRRWKDINYGPNAPEIEWAFHKMGRESQETLRAIVNTLISKDKISVDLDELGQALGMTVKEVRATQDDPSRSNGDPDVNDTQDIRQRDDKTSEGNVVDNGEPRATGRKISARVSAQVKSAWRKATFDSSFHPSFGFERRMVESLIATGIPGDEAESRTRAMYGRLDAAVSGLAALGMDSFDGPADAMAMIDRHIDFAIEEALK